jgi:glycosyltransferase involved in cell wall biosynthesis
MARIWSVNGRFLTQPVSGVQRYAREIVETLDRLIAQGHPLSRDLTVELLAPSGPVAPIALSSIKLRQTGKRGGHGWEQLVLPVAARGGLLSLGNTGPVAARRHIVCIHDMNTRLCPESYSAQFRALYRVLLPSLGRSAARIATVSHFSADQIAAFGIARRSKMAVIPNGHEHALRWTAQHSMRTELVDGPNTILVIGSAAPHKNIQLLLGMADQLAAAGLQLAIVGLADPRIFSAETPRTVAANIRWLGGITDAELAALLDDCLCLAFPSLTEGFGLPVLEAMARGCPVVVSDRASLPEVCGEAALYAAPADPDAWLAQFVALRADAGLRADMIERGRARARRFRWAKSAELYLKLMARLDGWSV